MAQKGMDVEQVLNFGNQLKGQYTEQLNSLKSQIQSAINGLNWTGPDADQFKGERNSSLGVAFDQLRAKFEEIGQIAINNANAQDQTSAS